MKAKFTMPENNPLEASFIMPENDPLQVNFNYDRPNTIATKAELNQEIEARTLGDDTLELEIKRVENKIPDVSDFVQVEDLEDYAKKDELPTVNNATLTIKANNEAIGNFSANDSIDKEINIPIPSKVSELTTQTQQNAIDSGITSSNVALINSALQPNDNITKLNNNAGFITNTVNNLTNYYSKTEIYTKQEVTQLIADIPKFTVLIVQTLPVTGEGMKLYLVPKDSEAPDIYNEYIWITDTSSYELIGSTAVDLSGYATEQWVTNQGYITDVITALGYTPYNSTNPNGYTSNIGTVTSVNNTLPDVNGNVSISIPDISNLATKTELNTKADKTQVLDYYGTSATAAGTQTKDVVCDGFTYRTGVTLRVKFTNAQSFNGVPRLNVNSTGAIDIKLRGTTNGVRYMWQAGEVVDFTYDGTNWIWERGGLATTTYYGVIKLSSSAVSTSSALAATPAAINAVMQNIATGCVPYSSSATYAVGDRVRYSTSVYICNTAITTPEAWTTEHWDEMPSLLEQIDAIKQHLGI